LKNTYKKSDAECAAKLNAIPIVHLHGDLGELPLPTKTIARQYENTVNEKMVSIAADRIKIIHDDISKNPQFAQAEQLLSTSHYICFLGLGYDVVNLQRIGFTSTSKYNHSNIIGTTYGLTEAERENVKTKRLFGRLQLHNRMCLGVDVITFLRENNFLQEASYP
jgi:hypothetical protein